ncbi:AI-2E family transporter [Elioraea tepida]|jgi:predicted PurR-regulated permease PerM|uniref:AI-2E family transporter n=1 Tax=Elioraea tepida TaxID=2843330 RepID=A0A975U0I0_9PROT|nr:AI-2E family transporter [Elioraea tepida]QXM23449.1 AI-2E family transporter [Elioraea tepida]
MSLRTAPEPVEDHAREPTLGRSSVPTADVGTTARPGPAERLRRQRLIAFAVGVAALLLALHLFAGILLPFVVAALIAYLLDPLADRLEAIGMPRGLAAFLLVTGVFALFVLFLLLFYPLLLAQLTILISRIPDYVGALRVLITESLLWLADTLGPEVVDRRLRELAVGQAAGMLGWIAGALGTLIGGGARLFTVLALAIVTPVVAFYLLRDWPKMLAAIDGWIPRRYLATTRQIAAEIDRVLAAWVRGQAIICLLLGAFYAVALTLAGLELGLIVGLTAGIISFIPYVGTLTGFVIGIGMAAMQFPTWQDVAVVAAIFVIGHTVEGYIIYPRLLGDRVQLHAVWVIFALFAGGAAFGFLGVLLAVPAAAAIGVIARFWLRRYLASPLFNDRDG